MSYKDTRAGLLNTEKRIFAGVGPFDIPQILPIKDVNTTGLKAVGFNYFFSEKNPRDKILHFFLDDYQFERVWKEPNKYIDRLRLFKYVIAPDFSLYTDHPKAVQIFNHYRKHWCARYWQEHGVNVIPCICWSDKSSYEWCFDGEPKNATVCVSTIGAFRNYGCDKQAWVDGYDEMYKQLNPSQIVIFGKEYEETKKDCRISSLQNEQLYRKGVLSTRSNTEGVTQIPVFEKEAIEHAQT